MDKDQDYQNQIQELTELINEEHANCTDNTCDISKCMENDFYLWAFKLFSGTGASSSKFDEIYSKLPPKFYQEAEKERVEFISSVPSIACPHCDAVVYDPEDSNYHCSNCAKDACFQVKLHPSHLEGLVDLNEAQWSDGFKVIREQETDNSTVYSVIMKYGKEPKEFTLKHLEGSIGVQSPIDAKMELI